MSIKKRYLAGVAIVATTIGWTFLPFWAQALTAIAAGVLMAPFAILIAAPLVFKEQLKHDPEQPEKTGMFIEVQQGRSAVIVRGGKPLYVVAGGVYEPDADDENEAIFYLWYLYQKQCYKYTGYHTYIPFYQKPHVYEVPRYELDKKGEEGYTLLGPDDKKYRSNHVRTEPTTWHFVFKGVDIQKVAFTIRGSVLIRIVPGMEITALFDIDSWSELLNQALESVIRNYMRASVSLDEILGSVSQELWTQPDKIDHMDDIAKNIKDKLRDYKVSHQRLKKGASGKTSTDFEKESTMTLLCFGLDIQRLDLRDFDVESKEERTKFAAAAIGREEGRRRSLEGQGIAEAEKKLLDVHDGGEVSLAIIQNRGFVDAVRHSNVAETLIGAIARKQLGDK